MKAQHGTLLLLTATYAISFIDRQIVSILAEPIKRDLELSDAALGFLTGTAFALFYASLGIPIARLADRTSRVRIIAVAMTGWSAMTLLCGLAGNFWQFALARIGVAVGEAGGTPPAHAIIGEMYDESKRSTAMGIYALGAPIGAGLGLVFGGWLSEIIGWRWTLVAVAVPGLLLGVALPWLIAEPRRRAIGEALRLPFGAALRAVTRTSAIRAWILGGACGAFCTYATLIWLPVLLIRVHGLGPGQVGLALGLISTVGGIAGAVGGGLLTDRLRKRTPRAAGIVAGGAMALALPCFVLLVLAPTATIALIGAALLIPLLYAPVAPLTATVQQHAPIALRATAAGVLLFINNIVGLGLGPQLVGWGSDLFAPMAGSDSLRYALLCIAPGYLLGAYLFVRASRSSAAQPEAAIEPDSAHPHPAR